MENNTRYGLAFFMICCFLFVFLLAGCSQRGGAGLPDMGTREERTEAEPTRQTDNIIGLSRAEEIALAHAGVKASEVRFTKTELDYDNGRAEYELEFVSDTYKYEYDVSASDGRILKFSKETILGGITETNAGGADATTVQPTAAPEIPTPQPTAAPDVPTMPQPTQSGRITLDEAKQIALAHAGLSASEVRFTKAELDYDDGIAEYEIEFYYAEREYEYKIDPASGMILESEIER